MNETDNVDQQKEILKKEEVITVADIIEMSKRGIGLRMTKADELLNELKNGVNGDFLATYNLVNFVDVKPELVQEAKRKMAERNQVRTEEELTYRIVTKAVNQNSISSIGELHQTIIPEFIAGIKDHIIRSIEMHQGNLSKGDNKVAAFFSPEMLNRLSGLVVIEKGTGPAMPYDANRYPPFGKYGKEVIPTEQMLGGVQIHVHDPDILALKAKYLPVINSSLNQITPTGTILSDIQSDLSELYLKRILKIVDGNRIDQSI